MARRQAQDDENVRRTARRALEARGWASVRLKGQASLG